MLDMTHHRRANTGPAEIAIAGWSPGRRHWRERRGWPQHAQKDRACPPAHYVRKSVWGCFSVVGDLGPRKSPLAASCRQPGCASYLHCHTAGTLRHYNKPYPEIIKRAYQGHIV
ncbi:hypothetical protein PR048_030770 [Dryococelus australis]|uniref:Uncharacterized protein n=1 Tax=Dryococelus australis TaxID=614101 RepID=A0ABQ9G9V7_9NEOP|nr:hypothetical protein PR048_030770 [Dryococelus australis]